MKELIKIIQKETLLQKQEPLEASKIIGAQKKLVKEGFPMLPPAMIDFLKIYNGLKGDGCAVLGIEPKEDMLDIFAFNKARNNAANKLIIGYDDFCFLVYDESQSRYLLIDRHDGQALDDFADLAYALSAILHF